MLFGSLFGAVLFKVTAIMSWFYLQCFSTICSNIKIYNGSLVTIMLFFHHNYVHMLTPLDTIKKKKYLSSKSINFKKSSQHYVRNFSIDVENKISGSIEFRMSH